MRTNMKERLHASTLARVQIVCWPARHHSPHPHHPTHPAQKNTLLPKYTDANTNTNAYANKNEILLKYKHKIIDAHNCPNLNCPAQKCALVQKYKWE